MFGPDWNPVYHSLYLLSVWVLGAFYAEVHAADDAIANLPERGAIILTSNHPNEILDIAVLATTIPHRRTIAFWAKAALFRNPILRAILRSSGAIPVSRRAISSSSPSGSSSSSPSPASKAYSPSTTVADGSLNVDPKPTEHAHSSKGGSLFAETLVALAPRGGNNQDCSRTLAVFPEGTSCTLPRVAQAKPGAARVALEYVKSELARQGMSDIFRYNNTGDRDKSVNFGISVVPVGVVYKDKTRYRSRVLVRYGSPIPLQHYAAMYLSDDAADSPSSREAVRQLTDEILRRMRDLVVDAQDWETLFTAEMARDILWDDDGNDNLDLNLIFPLERYVEVMQTLITIFGKSASSNIDDAQGLADLRLSLLRYHALLHHTGLTHAALSHVLTPFRSHITASFSSSSSGSEVQIIGELRKILPSVSPLVAYCLKVLPSMLFSLPAYIANAPGIVLASVSLRAMTRPDHEEPETRSQVAATTGWAGRIVGCMYAGWVCAYKMKEAEMSKTLTWVWHELCAMVGINRLINACAGLERAMTLASAMLIARFLWLWYEAVIDATDLANVRRLRASMLVLRAALSERSHSCKSKPTSIFVPSRYLHTPVPSPNPFLPLDVQSAFQRAEHRSDEEKCSEVKGTSEESIDADDRVDDRGSDRACTHMSRTELVIPLFLARAEAVERLRECFSPGSMLHKRLRASVTNDSTA